MSVVEQTLREDPGGLYGRMDFATRDRYRHVVEEIAQAAADLSESEVARKAIQLAHEARRRRRAAGAATTIATAHVGFYLVDEGRPQPRARGRACASRSPERLRRIGAAHAAVAAISARSRRSPRSLTAALLARSASRRRRRRRCSRCSASCCVLATSQLAVGMVNWLATLLVTPRPLPRMDFSRGIPRESRTLVVVPTMLTSAADIDEPGRGARGALPRQSRRAPALRPADRLPDAAGGDAARTTSRCCALARARHRGAQREVLGARTRGARGDATATRFFLFHRPRRWNPQERTWMGYERKRGKLADLNALLRGGGDGSLLARRRRRPPRSADVKYVITLDTDTQLPRDAARAVRRRDGASAESRALRRRRKRGERRAGDRGLRHPAAARGRRACPARTARGTRACTAATRASIPTRAPSPTSTRTCSAKARSSARGSTTSTRSSARSTAAFPRTGSSATTCSKAATRARGC